jgi:hypothetical protein
MRDTAASKGKSLHEGCRVSKYGADHPPNIKELPESGVQVWTALF